MGDLWLLFTVSDDFVFSLSVCCSCCTGHGDCLWGASTRVKRISCRFACFVVSVRPYIVEIPFGVSTFSNFAALRCDSLAGSPSRYSNVVGRLALLRHLHIAFQSTKQ